MSTQLVHVAVGVIVGGLGILIACRPESAHQGGLWEFPGGKVETDEPVQAALARELDEELGITVTGSQPLIEIKHDYGDKQVFLDVWWVTAFSGEPEGKEGQPIVWVKPEKLNDYAFPAANQPIITAIHDQLADLQARHQTVDRHTEHCQR